MRDHRVVNHGAHDARSASIVHIETLSSGNAYLMRVLQHIAVAILIAWLILDGMIVFRRMSGKAQNRDRFSLRVVAFGNMISWIAGTWLAYRQLGMIRPTLPAQIIGLLIMVSGIAVRSIAIAQLGRLHTPNVAVLDDHEVFDQGLYRRIRHPSYLGALIAFLGFSLALGSWLSLIVIMALSLFVYLFRIHEEEAALAAGLGEQYADYRRRTWRLVPGVF